MPELENRIDRERRLTSALMIVLDTYADDFLRNGHLQHMLLETEITDAFRDHTRRTYLAASRRFEDQFKSAPDLPNVREDATKWAEKYSSLVAEQMTSNTRMVIKRLDKQGADRPEIINRVFRRSRAEAAAVSSITDAVSAAEMKGANKYKKLGLKLVAFWQTSLRDNVCAICEPLNDQPEIMWRDEFPNGPKAHVNCACFLRWEIVRA